MPAKIVLKVTGAVKIQVVLDQNNPDSVTIEIEDPSEVVKVNYASMTQIAPNVYQYVWQSTSSDDDGDYKITIVATYGNYKSVEQSYFTLEDID